MNHNGKPHKRPGPPPEPRSCLACGTLTRRRSFAIPSPRDAEHHVREFGVAIGYDVPICVAHDPTGPEAIEAIERLFGCLPVALRPDAPAVYMKWLRKHGRPVDPDRRDADGDGAPGGGE